MDETKIEQDGIIEKPQISLTSDLEHNEMRPMKRMRDDGSSEIDEEEDKQWEWHTVTRSGKKGKKIHKEDVEVYVSSLEILPKQFAMARFLKENGITSKRRVKYLSP